MATSEERYVFKVEWYDKAAALIRPYNLTYYIADNTIDMYDLKKKRMFLKRSEYPSVTIKDLYLGCIITVHGRQLKLVEYADVFTKKRFQTQTERTFAMIKPDVYTSIGKIINRIESEGFTINKLKMTKLTVEDARGFYAEHEGKGFFDDLINFVTSDVVVGLELVGENAISNWRTLIGPTRSQTARAEAPNSIRGIFGTDATKNAVHGSDSATSAKRELDYFFGAYTSLSSKGILNNCSCLVIKPHAVKSGRAGQIIDCILEEGFEVSALEMFNLDKPTSEEFFEVYKGVLAEYTPIVEHMTSGASIALEVRQENVVKALRELVGPHDPAIAKTLRPNSIRSKFGLDRVKNAVHCTDLPEDGVLECEYFFNILQQK